VRDEHAESEPDVMMLMIVAKLARECAVKVRG
jgi:hypothetical protein